MKTLLPGAFILTVAAFTGFLNQSAHGAVLVSDNFEGRTTGVTISGAPWSTASGNTGYRTTANQTTSTVFGSTNKFANFTATNIGTDPFIRLISSRAAGAYNAATTLSFDFYEPSGGGDGTMIFGYSGSYGASNTWDLNTAGRRASATLNNGTIGGLTGGTTSYDLDQAYTLYMIFNDTASSLDYDGGTVNSYSAHVWIEELGTGIYQFAGSTAAANTQNTAGYGAGFRTFNTVVQSVWVDNFQIASDTVAIPEPATAMLGGLGVLALLRRRRAL